MRRSLAFILTLLLGTPIAHGQESVALRFKKDAGPGGTVFVEKRETIKARTRLISPKTGEAQEDNQQSKIVALKYRETILERAPSDKEATRLRRVYETATVKEAGEPTPLPIQGKTILIEKIDDQYRFRFEDGRELTPREAEALADEFQNAARPRLDLDELFAKDAVRIGETQQINPRLLVKLFRPLTGPRMIDEFKPKSEWKLVRAYRKDGRQYGVLELRINLPLQELIAFPGIKTKPAGEKLFLRPGAALRVVLTVDGCLDAGAIDLTTSINTSLDGTAEVPARDHPLLHLLLAVETATEVVIRDPSRVAE